MIIGEGACGCSAATVLTIDSYKAIVVQTKKVYSLCKTERRLHQTVFINAVGIIQHLLNGFLYLCRL